MAVPGEISRAIKAEVTGLTGRGEVAGLATPVTYLTVRPGN